MHELKTKMLIHRFLHDEVALHISKTTGSQAPNSLACEVHASGKRQHNHSTAAVRQSSRALILVLVLTSATDTDQYADSQTPSDTEVPNHHNVSMVRTTAKKATLHQDLQPQLIAATVTFVTSAQDTGHR